MSVEGAVDGFVDGLVDRLPLSEGVVSPARNGGKSDLNVDDLFVALNVDEPLFSTFRLTIIAGAERMVEGKYSEASRRLLRRAWRVVGLRLLRRRSIVVRRDGAGEKHLGGQRKIAEELLTGVCLTEEFGAAPEESDDGTIDGLFDGLLVL